MNILGMGTLEILIVLLLAFILLGTGRMVDAARLLGKASREIRRMSEELPRLTQDEAEGPAERRPQHQHRGGSGRKRQAREPGRAGPAGRGAGAVPALRHSQRERKGDR